MVVTGGIRNPLYFLFKFFCREPKPALKNKEKKSYFQLHDTFMASFIKNTYISQKGVNLTLHIIIFEN